MSKLEELLKRECPDGVEWKKLGDIGRVAMCKRVMKAETEKEGDIPFYKIGTFGKKADAFISRELFEEYRNKYSFPKKGDILISASGTIGRTVIYDGEAAYYQDSNIVWLEHDESIILNKYLFYYYQLKPWNITSGGTIQRLYNENIMNAKIQIPPIEVQEEIVGILDTFTKYQDLLNRELELRKKQYEYYRDKLLTFGDDVPLKKLGDIAIDIYRGTGIKKDEVTEKGIPCVRYGEIYTKYNIWFDKCFSHTIEENIKNRKYFEYGDVLFAITGESVKEISKSCVYIGHDKCLAGGDIVVLKHNQNPKYMGYVLSTTNAQIQKSKGKVKSKVVHSNVQDISDILIPVPPLEEQERIVNILDKFDALCNDITMGLPAEIEMRKKQYEYYRDKLLTFKEKKI